MPLSVGDMVRALAARIATRPHADGLREARAMVEAVTGLDQAAQLAQSGRLLQTAHVAALEALAVRREAGEPLARLLGRAAFWDFEVGLNDATLIPRDETGARVEAALALLPADRTVSVVDLGTGSGIILLALARERPHLHGLGIDVADGAVKQAQANAEALGLSEQLRFETGDWLTGVAETFDMIVSNPPYIAATALDALEPEVRLHDPARALVAGDDGLAAYRNLLPQAAKRVCPGGHVLMEIGADQAKEVTALGVAVGLHPLEVHLDLGGRDRVVVFQPMG